MNNLIPFVDYHTNYFENVLYIISHRKRKNKNIKTIMLNNLSTPIILDPSLNVLRI